jgi:hypothetical protein
VAARDLFAELVPPNGEVLGATHPGTLTARNTWHGGRPSLIVTRDGTTGQIVAIAGARGLRPAQVGAEAEPRASSPVDLRGMTRGTKVRILMGNFVGGGGCSVNKTAGRERIRRRSSSS